MSVALPMYRPADPQAVQNFWDLLRPEIAMRLGPQHRLALPTTLEWPTDYNAHWRSPSLLLSQSCGYPLTHALRGQVHLLGTFTYRVRGAEGTACRSQIIHRCSDARRTLAQYQGSCVAYNATDSQSGYNALRALIAPLAQEGRFFGERLETGAHMESIAAVAQGKADLAAIDAVSWALAQDIWPALTQGLRVLMQSDAYPGLPLITSVHTPPAIVAVLQKALHHVATEPRYAAARRPLHIDGFVPTVLEDYAVCEHLRVHAAALGVLAL